jgi:hypothetical protein
MSSTFAKILFVGVPLILSLAWFAFWVVKLTRTARKLKKQSGEPGNEPPSS